MKGCPTALVACCIGQHRAGRHLLWDWQQGGDPWSACLSVFLGLSCCKRHVLVALGSGGDVRELSIVLNLVLEVAQLCDNLFALICPHGVGALRDGAVSIVDGLCLFWEVKVSEGHSCRQGNGRKRERQTDYYHGPSVTGSGPSERSLVGGRIARCGIKSEVTASVMSRVWIVRPKRTGKGKQHTCLSVVLHAVFELVV